MWRHFNEYYDPINIIRMLSVDGYYKTNCFLSGSYNVE